MSSTREVDSEKREGIKNDKDGFHFGDWKDVNRKGVVRNGRGQSGGRDKSGAHMQEGGGRPWKVGEHRDEERME